MLLPLMWLRKRKLDRLLKDYPLYDPPHKVEERLLPKEKARENFDYFMRVRQERAEFFIKWLKDEFGVKLTADNAGVAALNNWVVRFGGLLLPSEIAENSYFSYDPPWVGDCAGCNVVFDIGIVLGEFMIANCPNLRWEMGPASTGVSPGELRDLTRDFGSSLFRPEITGFKLSDWGQIPLHHIWMYVSQMRETTTFAERRKLYGFGGINRNLFVHQLERIFSDTINRYHHPDMFYQAPCGPDDSDEEDDDV